ncbi:hypothetical protein NBRC116590_17060 [Pelagimonas sp. KU-00592-HH]|uniref:DUF5681 domain-containing protein n=1 Tax=Pelagimonas sp. KU-00592-HH TaxID=3127651 RepID=UPI0031045ACB
MTDDDSVGYGKPPKEHQWKPGQSGNPKGRPKNSTEYLARYAEILNEPVKARRQDGSTTRLEGFEAAYLELCRKGLNGNISSLVLAVRTMLEFIPEGQEAENTLAAESEGAKRRFWEMAFGPAPCPLDD